MSHYAIDLIQINTYINLVIFNLYPLLFFSSPQNSHALRKTGHVLLQPVFYRTMLMFCSSYVTNEIVPFRVKSKKDYSCLACSPLFHQTSEVKIWLKLSFLNAVRHGFYMHTWIFFNKQIFIMWSSKDMFFRYNSLDFGFIS